MKLPFTIEIPLDTNRRRGYGWCWLVFERHTIVIAPQGLHILYGALYLAYILWLRGFCRVNRKLESQMSHVVRKK